MRVFWSSPCFSGATGGNVDSVCPLPPSSLCQGAGVLDGRGVQQAAERLEGRRQGGGRGRRGRGGQSAGRPGRANVLCRAAARLPGRWKMFPVHVELVEAVVRGAGGAPVEALQAGHRGTAAGRAGILQVQLVRGRQRGGPAQQLWGTVSAQVGQRRHPLTICVCERTILSSARCKSRGRRTSYRREWSKRHGVNVATVKRKLKFQNVPTLLLLSLQVF